MSTRRLIAIAVGAAVVTLAVLVAAILRTALGGPSGPEIDATRTFLAAMLAGEGEDAYGATSDAYRTFVLPGELDQLADLLHELAGDGPTIRIVGSEATSEMTRAVGYLAETGSGDLEGVVTVVREQAGWAVQDASWHFVEALDEAQTRLEQLLAELNEQVAERAGAG